MDEVKPFDWTFTTDYKGTLTGGFVVTPTDTRIDIEKLRQREKILFYHDLLLFEDELHDNGTAVCSVKIVSRTRKEKYLYKTRRTAECFTLFLVWFNLECVGILIIFHHSPYVSQGQYQTGWCSGSAVHWYLGDTQFRSQLCY